MKNDQEQTRNRWAMLKPIAWVVGGVLRLVAALLDWR